jgi:dihydropteroate synthase
MNEMHTSTLVFNGGSLSFEYVPKIMGILNVTPDSFSDGGCFHDLECAVERALEMLDSGVDVIDIGGESTRPGAESVSIEEEIARVVPVIKKLKQAHPKCVLSIDTMKYETAKAALDVGVDIINDVTGLRNSPEIANLVAEKGAGLILMHMRGTPATMKSLTKYNDVVADVSKALLESAKIAESAGVQRESIMLDPGLGFAKNTIQNLEILRRICEFRKLGYPLLVGPSRKSFIGDVLAIDGVAPPPEEREWGTAAVVAWLTIHNVELIRVHTACESREVVKIIRSIEDGN